jgi:hypothetical protein
MLEQILNEIFKLGGEILSVLQQFNSLILNTFGGPLLVITALAALAAWRKASKANKNSDAMQKLAEAIIRHYNKELKEEK